MENIIATNINLIKRAVKVSKIILALCLHVTISIGLPNDEPRFCMQDIEVDDTDFTFYDNYPISFCPHCGKPIEIEVTETIDFTEGYNTLAKKKHDTLERLRNTDSIKEYDKLLVQKKDLDEKINAISELCEYSEEDFKE